MKLINNRVPTTLIKLFIAKRMYHLVSLLFGSDKRIISRHGINFEVDLSEGIDFSLFLFGDFQKHVINTKYISLKPDAIILDVGANVGAMTLKLASLVPNGRVIAFEPTDYALSKLKKNISLNKGLEQRISIVQAFVSDKSLTDHNLIAYSSWKLDDQEISNNQHPIHGGTIKPAQGINSISLDDYCSSNNINQVDFIKVDTDGHEYQVFEGARNTIQKCLPYVVFEVGLYLLEENGIHFEQFEEYFSPLGYIFLNSTNGRRISSGNYLNKIPAKGTIDILALPQNHK